MNNEVSETYADDAAARAKAALTEGERLLDVGDFDAAEAKLREALDLQPESAHIHNKLGVCYIRQQREEEARHEWTRALELDPGHAPAHSNIGNLHQQAGRLDAAKAAYLEALRHDPEYYIAHHNLGAVYRKMGRIGDAVKQLRRANRLEKQHMRTRPSDNPASRSPWRLVFWLAAGALLAYLFAR